MFGRHDRFRSSSDFLFSYLNVCKQVTYKDTVYYFGIPGFFTEYGLYLIEVIFLSTSVIPSRRPSKRCSGDLEPTQKKGWESDPASERYYFTERYSTEHVQYFKIFAPSTHFQENN